MKQSSPRDVFVKTSHKRFAVIETVRHVRRPPTLTPRCRATSPCAGFGQRMFAVLRSVWVRWFEPCAKGFPGCRTCDRIVTLTPLSMALRLAKSCTDLIGDLKWPISTIFFAHFHHMPIWQETGCEEIAPNTGRPITIKTFRFDYRFWATVGQPPKDRHPFAAGHTARIETAASGR